LEAIRLQLLDCQSAKMVLERIIALPKIQKELVAITLWDWWNARNKANAGERLKTTDEICHSISIHHLEFSKLPTPLTVAPQKQSAWKIPSAGYVKVNFDASFYHESQTGAFGYVIRDDKEEFLAAGAGKLPYLRNVLCTAWLKLVLLQWKVQLIWAFSEQFLNQTLQLWLMLPRPEVMIIELHALAS
jgi:hypothetical protein